MIKYKISKIAEITEGQLFIPDSYKKYTVNHIVTDSRTFVKGENSLFFALKGPRNNGHNYIPLLIKRGMKAFVVSEPACITPGAIFVLVQNTTIALQKLAAFHRSLYHYPVIAITGSNGKTIVKEWLTNLFADIFRIVKSPKSYNSQIGVPLSVLLMDDHYDLGIFEAGISNPGEMEKLVSIIMPDIGILTNIGDAHQENFDSIEQKIHEKLLLFKPARKLIFCKDDIHTANIVEDFCREHAISVVSWTLSDSNAFIRFSKKTDNGYTLIKAEKHETFYHFKIPFTDDSSIENACHCFALASVILANPENILPAFERLEPVAMRLEIKQGMNNCLLINDYYNSDLASLSIALTVLHHQSKSVHLKKQVILSDLQQTGIPGKELYSRVNKLLEQWNIDLITGIGHGISANSGLFSMNKRFYPSTAAFENAFSRNDFTDSVILIKGARAFAFERISSLLQQKAHQTILEIDMNALVNNLNIFRSLLMPATKIMVMVKAFSYGSGDVEIAKLLQFQNVDYLAVAVADEGVVLRHSGIQIPVMVMNPEEHSFQNMIDYSLEPNIYSVSLLRKFMKTVSQNSIIQFPVHIKIDTGMNRLGFKEESDIDALIGELTDCNQVRIKTVFSHLAAADDPEMDAFTWQQIKSFEDISERILKVFPYHIDRHILNSAGIERFPEKQFDMVRLGIGLYGISLTQLPLQSISTFRSTVSQIKKVNPGETVGYNRMGKIADRRDIAIVPVGYADGLDRRLGNGTGQAFIKGQRVPVVGNICMDMLMLDVTGLNVVAGDSVEFFGNNIPVSEMAEKTGTIPYEILTGVSQRVKRVYMYE